MIKKLECNKSSCNVHSVYNYDALTMQELLCTFFSKINECVDVTNNTNSKILTEVKEKLNLWLEDGTIEDVINEKLFNNLKGKVDGLAFVITTNGKDDSIQLATAIELGFSHIKLLGELIFKTNVVIPSNISIYGDSSTKIKSYAPTLFTLKPTTSNVTFEDLDITNYITGDTLCFYLEGGTDPGFENSVNNVLIKNVRIQDFKVACDLKRCRQINIENISIHGHSGIKYHHKSAEVNIINSYIVHYTQLAPTGSFGIWSYSDSENYPEGLTVTNTLIYNFENNILIDDLYVGNFTNCHVDGLTSHTINNVLMRYTNKNERVSFNDCWLIAKGITFGENQTSPKTYRSSINNCKFDSIQDQAIRFNRWSHQITVNNTSIIGDNKGSNRIAISRDGMNDNIVLSNINIMFFDNYVIFNGTGENCSIKGITGNSTIATPIYCESPIDIDNIALISGISQFTKDMKDLNLVAGSDSFVSPSISVACGTHKVQLVLDNANITKAGHLRLSIDENSNIKPLSGSLSTHAYATVGDSQRLVIELPFAVIKPTKITLKVYADTISGTFGWFGKLTLIKA